MWDTLRTLLRFASPIRQFLALIVGSGGLVLSALWGRGTELGWSPLRIGLYAAIGVGLLFVAIVYLGGCA